MIQSRIASLRDMLEELFTYARLQDKEAPLALEPVDFAACVYDTVFAFYEDFQAKGLTPQADFCDGHLWVQGNGEALRRTVQNLVKKRPGTRGTGDCLRPLPKGRRCRLPVCQPGGPPGGDRRAPGVPPVLQGRRRPDHTSTGLDWPSAQA